MKYYIPETLNLKKFENFPEKHRDKYLYFISLLNTRRNYKITTKNTDYVYLKATFLRHVNTRDKSNMVINDLVRWGVIEIQKNSKGKDTYQAGVRSKGYRFTVQYRGVKVRTEVINEKMQNRIEKFAYSDIVKDDELLTIEDRFKVFIAKLNNLESDVASKYNNLKNAFNDISIEYDAAIEHLQKLKLTGDQYNLSLISLDKILEREFYFKLDMITGRIFTNITNLRKEFRQFLRYQGEPLVEIDIANSQPFLFNKIVQHKGIHIGLFERLTTQGKFYKYFTKEYNKEYKENKTIPDIKEVLFGKVFFCRKYMNNIYKESKLFKKLFPEEFKIIIEEKEFSYRHLANKLQTIEADTIIQKIAIPLSKKIPIFTIHDSILTTKDNVIIVKKKIDDTFNKIFNLSPKVKVKN